MEKQSFKRTPLWEQSNVQCWMCNEKFSCKMSVLPLKGAEKTTDLQQQGVNASHWEKVNAPSLTVNNGLLKDASYTLGLCEFSVFKIAFVVNFSQIWTNMKGIQKQEKIKKWYKPRWISISCMTLIITTTKLTNAHYLNLYAFYANILSRLTHKMGNPMSKGLITLTCKWTELW